LRTQFFYQELARYCPVPVINALSSLWHPTQILADLLTLRENAHIFSPEEVLPPGLDAGKPSKRWTALPNLPSSGLTIAYVGDSANVLHDMLVTYPRMGHKLRVASPEGYRAPKAVWDRVTELRCDSGIWWGSDPREAVKDADVVVTDTWYLLAL
jgi:ornithine carbamoyltransferase